MINVGMEDKKLISGDDKGGMDQQFDGYGFCKTI